MPSPNFLAGSAIILDAPGDLHLVVGSFAPANGAAPTAVKGKGFNSTITYVSTGLWTITLLRTYAALVSGGCTIQLKTEAEVSVQFATIDVVTAGTFQITAQTSGSVVDPTPDGNTRVHFQLYLSTTALNS